MPSPWAFDSADDYYNYRPPPRGIWGARLTDIELQELRDELEHVNKLKRRPSLQALLEDTDRMITEEYLDEPF